MKFLSPSLRNIFAFTANCLREIQNSRNSFEAFKRPQNLFSWNHILIFEMFIFGLAFLLYFSAWTFCHAHPISTLGFDGSNLNFKYNA